MRIDLCLYDVDNPIQVGVYPSLVAFHFPDGDTVTISVGDLYAIFAAHLRQNGIWGDVNWEDVSPRVRKKFVDMELYQPAACYELVKR